MVHLNPRNDAVKNVRVRVCVRAREKAVTAARGNVFYGPQWVPLRQLALSVATTHD